MFGGDPPIETMPRDQIFLIKNCVIDLDGKDIPDIDEDIVSGLAEQFYNLDVHGIFDDENVTDEQWAEWKKEANK